MTWRMHSPTWCSVPFMTRPAFHVSISFKRAILLWLLLLVTICWRHCTPPPRDKLKLGLRRLTKFLSNRIIKDLAESDFRKIIIDNYIGYRKILYDGPFIGQLFIYLFPSAYKLFFCDLVLEFRTGITVGFWNIAKFQGI